MKITKISIYQVDLPFSGKAYRLSGGRSLESLDTTIVAIETDQGITGWGETCPFGPSYLPGFATGARVGLAELAPQLIGEDPRQLGKINQLMDQALRGQLYVKSALDMACWDILGKAADLPVYHLMGGRLLEDQPIVASVSSEDSTDSMLANIARFRAAGYRHYSAKASGNPDQDIIQFRKVAADMRPGEILYVDANTGWLQHEAMRVVRGLRECDVYIEQPCATYDECLTVRKHTDHPMILDEIVQGLDVLLRAYQDGVADVINLKISKVGGLTKARQIRDLCVSLGIAVSIQDTGGSEFTQAAIAHLAHSTPAGSLLSVWDCTELSDVRTGDGGAEVREGNMRSSSKAGLGVTPRLEVLGKPVAVFD